MPCATKRVSAALLSIAFLAAGTMSGRATGAWSTLPDAPYARTEAYSIAMGDDVYLIGGLAEAPEHQLGLNRVDIYNVGTGTWRAGPALPIPLHHTGAVALGSKIVVVGGYLMSAAFVPTPMTWILDTALSESEQRWERFVSLPEPRGAHAVASDGARIWVFGGVGPATGLASTSYVLEPGAQEWSQIATMPFSRDHLAGAFVDGKVYAIGGRRISLGSNTGRVNVFDPATGEWSERTWMRSFRGGTGAAVVGSKIVVIGGEQTTGVFDNVEAYDTTTDEWESLAPMLTARHGIGVAATTAGIHVLTGGTIPGFSYSTTHELLG